MTRRDLLSCRLENQTADEPVCTLSLLRQYHVCHDEKSQIIIARKRRVPSIFKHPVVVTIMSIIIVLCCVARINFRFHEQQFLQNPSPQTRFFLLASALEMDDETKTSVDQEEEEEEEHDESYDTANQIDELRDRLRVTFPHKTEQLGGTATDAAAYTIKVIGENLQSRLESLFLKAKTVECREKIATHFGYFVNAIGLEENLPFSDMEFPNECGEPVYIWKDLPEEVNPGDIQNRTYQPPHSEAAYIEDANKLKLAYGIMTHDNPEATIRLIDTLYEDGHVFIVHVDGKEVHDTTHRQMTDYAATRPYVHVLNHPYRVRVNWGGFSMVNATLQMLRYAFAIHGRPDIHTPLDFHKFVHISSSTYPLASNLEIRYRLSQYPLDANFLNIVMQPVRPRNDIWHYFVECDDAVHRIYQLPSPHTATMNAELFTSSQWFIASREFALYMADPPAQSFVEAYLKYIQHAVVADESFFGTVLRHTKFCKKHHNSNFLHLQFDRWESELPAGKRDERKCPMPNPDHCGRSPTTMTVDYADILELSNDLFARKFNDEVDSKVKDILDDWRKKRVEEIQNGATIESVLQPKSIDFEGHGVLIVAKDTTEDAMPLCLGLGDTGNEIRLTPCFRDWVPRTLGEQWETGAVVKEETMHHVRWQIGPCTSDGIAERSSTGQMNVTKGSYSPTGPRCMLKQMDGLRAGRCFDAQSESVQPGGPTQVFPCFHKWFQFVSFGDGEHTPLGSIYTTLPSHNVRQIQNLGHEQSSHMCLGVLGRGMRDELDWFDTEYQKKVKERAAANVGIDDSQLPGPLSAWSGEHIVTTRCDNTHGVIEWVMVPYIVETDEDTEGDEHDDSADSTNEKDEASHASRDEHPDAETESTKDVKTEL